MRVATFRFNIYTFFIFQVHINNPVCSIPNLCAHLRSENDDRPNKETHYDLLFSQNFKKAQFESLSSASRSNSQISDLSDFNLSDTGKISSTSFYRQLAIIGTYKVRSEPIRNGKKKGLSVFFARKTPFFYNLRLLFL